MGELTDPADFRALFQAHFAELHRYLAHRLGDPGAAEDLAAETFLRAYRARAGFRVRRDGSARAWLFTIATNLLRERRVGGACAPPRWRASRAPKAPPARPTSSCPIPSSRSRSPRCGPRSSRRSSCSPGPSSPHQPKALAAFLRDAARRQRPGGPERNITNTFGTDVTTFLRYPRTPPDLRAALLEVFATVPGAKLLGRIRDGAGRTAAAIDLPDDMNDAADIVAFDPATARLVAEGISNGPGSVRWLHTYALSAAGVARVGERP
jgi:Sigma-70 region 2